MNIQKTIYIKPELSKKKWVIVDAKGQTLGRLCSIVSKILQGKHKPDYVPFWDNGDNVIIINSKFVKLTGKKYTDMLYRWHTNFPGGVKEFTYENLLKRDPTRPLYITLKGMLPKNKIGRKLMRNVRIYPDENHPHKAQNPEIIDLSKYI
ncbi:MAG: 50S ribosomal protein L13 [Spirochaetes bacterium]|nr:50S ribosomal protein L13 [Spirochaetota bacterium]